MKRGVSLVLCLLAFAATGWCQWAPQCGYRVRYTLLEESYFIDDCLVCGRPTILEPLRGTFDLTLVQNTAPYTRYDVQNVRFKTGPDSWLDRWITGGGTYTRFEEFARIQDMQLAVNVQDPFTNRPAFFTNGTPVATAPDPLIQVLLTQTNGSLLQTFSMRLLAAPLREIWFSTARAFTATNWNAPSNQISAGDLLSNSGRVVKRNSDLVGRLGVMPVVPDLGLDAVYVTGRGEILFSITQSVFSESLGPLQHGDLLSDRGRIVKRNQELLAAFKPPSSADAGLDAVSVLPSGEILFSIQSNLAVSATLKLSRGDILSDRGVVFMTHQELLRNFHPPTAGQDYGLDALHLLPTGEVWFSVEDGFVDSQLGPIQAGDLLSDRGYRVFSNRGLLAPFGLADPGKDYGLDAVYVISDTEWPKPPPRLIRLQYLKGTVHFEWDGEGSVFQLERAHDPFGPWEPCSPILPELGWDDTLDASGSAAGFYRLHQW